MSIEPDETKRRCVECNTLLHIVLVQLESVHLFGTAPTSLQLTGLNQKNPHALARHAG